MTNENKQLLLQDLCGRLPYGVKCAYFNTKGEIKVGELLSVCCKGKRVFNVKLRIDYDGGGCIGTIPYLFPLSSMTEEQKKEYNDLLYIGPSTGVDYLNKNHFDYRGLIPMGLAIDATGKNIY